MMWDISGSGAQASSPDYHYPPPASSHQPGFPVPQRGYESGQVVPFAPIGAPSSYQSSHHLPHSQSSYYSSSSSPTYPSDSQPYASRDVVQRSVAITHTRNHHHHHSSTQHVHSTHHSKHSSDNHHHHSSSHSRPVVIAQHPSNPTGQVSPRQYENFRYSKCTGRKKALCIGINYYGKSNELRGCVNDARNVKQYLIDHWNYKDEDIVLLTDDSRHARQRPTRANMLDAMRWLVKGAHEHDSLFFHYSGHGGQVKDLDGDEIDGLDEVIFPVDYRTAGSLTDDLLHIEMVKPLPRGCRLTAIFDSCHSGSVLDLPYEYHSDGKVKGSQVTPSHIEEKKTWADVISWAGCMDNQTSADTYQGGVAVGAMSYAFMKALSSKRDQSYQELLKNIRAILNKKYSQKPQLSSSHRIDTNLKFIM